MTIGSSLLGTICLLLVFSPLMTGGFSPVVPLQRPHVSSTHQSSLQTSPQRAKNTALLSPLFHNKNNNLHQSKQFSLLKSPKSWINVIQQRFDTITLAGYDSNEVLCQGLFGNAVSRVKKLHNPKTYMVLLALAGLKWDWCFRSIYYWFVFAFCIKWYRARYVFKIPVWDRQPNWNNVITSKEQEKDLKAFTCKKCGSTIFIAKTREFFFEGDTGIGGLGCFSCGAKGKENFIMDRDRIVEDGMCTVYNLFLFYNLLVVLSHLLSIYPLYNDCGVATSTVEIV